jgi:hypothetical protein
MRELVHRPGQPYVSVRATPRAPLAAQRGGRSGRAAIPSFLL